MNRCYRCGIVMNKVRQSVAFIQWVGNDNEGARQQEAVVFALCHNCELNMRGMLGTSHREAWARRTEAPETDPQKWRNESCDFVEDHDLPVFKKRKEE